MESKLTSQLKDSFVKVYGEDCFYHKISDLPISWLMAMANQYHIPADKVLRFSHKKPFDVFLSIKGQAVALELKEVKTDRFDFKIVKEHQIEALNNFRKSGGLAYVFVFFTKYDCAYVWDIYHITNMLLNGIKSANLITLQETDIKSIERRFVSSGIYLTREKQLIQKTGQHLTVWNVDKLLPFQAIDRVSV